MHNFYGTAGHDLFLGRYRITHPDISLTGSTVLIRVRTSAGSTVLRVSPDSDTYAVVTWDGVDLVCRFTPAGTRQMIGRHSIDLTLTTAGGIVIGADLGDVRVVK